MVDEEITEASEPINIGGQNTAPPFAHNYPAWSKEEITEAEELIESMLDYYPNYHLMNGITVRENDEGGFYYGRDHEDTPEDQPLIEAAPSRKIISLAHELGHDALVESLPRMHGSQLVLSTFKEMFADLNTLYFTSVDIDNKEPQRDPDKDLSVYEGLDSIFDERTWEEGLMQVDRMLEGAQREEWRRVQDGALSLTNDLPTAETVTDIRNLSSQNREEEYIQKLVTTESSDHLLYNNLFQFDEVSPLEELSKRTQDIWSIAQVMANRDIMDPSYPVRQTLQKESRINQKLASTASRIGNITSDPEKVLKRTLELELQRTNGEMEHIRQELEKVENPEQYILDSISNEKYGKSYDVTIDYPHNIGGQLAEQIYRQGVEPIDVLENPGEYIEQGTARIRQHISENL